MSGYVAAGFAGATIYYLTKQIREQKKQTDFVLGENPPTFDAYSEGIAEIYLRVVNWNRRTFLIDRVECGDFDSIEVEEVNIQHHKTQYPLIDDRPTFSPPIRVAAFDDRSVAPAICRIKARVFGGVGVQTIDANFELHGRLLGEAHAELVLTAVARVETFGGGSV